MPEREGVAGVEPAVRELVHVEVEVAELDQLANPREVEEAVAADLARDVPEQQPEHGAGRPDRGPSRAARHGGRAGSRTGAATSARPRAGRARARATRGRRRRRSSRANTTPRPQASVAEVLRTPTARAAIAPGASTSPVASREPDEQEQRAHRSISVRTSPEPIQRAASRYIAPFWPRTTRPRRRERPVQQRPHPLRLVGPWCLRKKRRCPRRLSR